MLSGIRSAVSVSRLARLVLMKWSSLESLSPSTVPAGTPCHGLGPSGVRLSTGASFGLRGGGRHRGGSRVAAMPGTWRGNVYLVASFFVGLATFTFLVTAIL